MLNKVVKCSDPLPFGSKLLVLGAGFSGKHIAKAVRLLGTEVLCTRRAINLEGADIEFDSTSNTIPSFKHLKGVSHVISCIPPSENGDDPVLQTLGNELHKMPLQWVGYLSTTGVYGDCNGNWVSEKDPTNPGQIRSQRRLACEKEWINSRLPVQILRLPGIYGPGRSAIQTIQAGKANRINKPGQVFSRIHIDDIAGAVIHLINLYEKGIKPKIVNISDNLPTSNIEVLNYGASLLGGKLPPIIDFQLASKEMSQMALSFWRENRRVSNTLLCKELKYSLIHPDYISGLKDCLDQY